MRTWIFQGNPDEYDVDAYLASRPAQLVWLVTRYASDIAVGDRVYLWRNQGKQNAVSGIIAEGIVTIPPELRGEASDAVPFWRTGGPRAAAPQLRAVMRLVKIATSREVLRRDWCMEDPVLRELPNLRMQAGTNYPVLPEQALRLGALWSRTGRDWARNELVAGLMIYAETYGQPVSKLPGSPVARVALMTGRAVNSVYAKVMNFRYLDPRAEGKGMSRAGEKDRDVWMEFYDSASSTIRMDALTREYARLWGETEVEDEVVAPPDVNATAESFSDEAERLEGLTLEQLLTKYATQAPQRSARPSTRVLSARAYERDPLVVAIAQLRAAHRCEVHGCAHPTFETSGGRPYSEVHHIVPLAEGGDDTIENVACLCPAHHKEVHLGVRSAELTDHLKGVRRTDRTSA